MRLVALCLGVAIGVSGCAGAADAGAPDVAAAFYPLAWAAEQVAAPGASIADLTPTGAEPHDLELTPSDVEKIHDAKLVLYLGRGFQPAVEEAVAKRHGPSLDLLQGTRLRLATDDENLGVDPHVWLDPVRFGDIVQRVGRALGRPGAAERVSARLHALDDDMRAGLRSCARREIVTTHAAFGYLAERYRLRQVPLEGLVPEAEPTPRALERLVDEVRRSGATTVFFETLVSPRLAQTVAREAGARAAVLDPIEGLTAKEEHAGGDYLTIMRANLSALREALGCR